MPIVVDHRPANAEPKVLSPEKDIKKDSMQTHSTSEAAKGRTNGGDVLNILESKGKLSPSNSRPHLLHPVPEDPADPSIPKMAGAWRTPGAAVAPCGCGDDDDDPNPRPYIPYPKTPPDDIEDYRSRDHTRTSISRVGFSRLSDGDKNPVPKPTAPPIKVFIPTEAPTESLPVRNLVDSLAVTGQCEKPDKHGHGIDKSEPVPCSPSRLGMTTDTCAKSLQSPILASSRVATGYCEVQVYPEGDDWHKVIKKLPEPTGAPVSSGKGLKASTVIGYCDESESHGTRPDADDKQPKMIELLENDNSKPRPNPGPDRTSNKPLKNNLPRHRVKNAVIGACIPKGFAFHDKSDHEETPTSKDAREPPPKPKPGPDRPPNEPLNSNPPTRQVLVNGIETRGEGEELPIHGTQACDWIPGPVRSHILSH